MRWPITVWKDFSQKDKLNHTGNPIRKSIVDGKLNPTEAKAFFKQIAGIPTLVVLGGSLGARRINQLIATHLDTFEKQGLQLIWQCGSLYYDQYKKYQSERVKIMPFVVEMDQLYAAADMVISRSGAATLSELCCAATPGLYWFHHPMLLKITNTTMRWLWPKGAALVIAEKDLDLNFEVF